MRMRLAMAASSDESLCIAITGDCARLMARTLAAADDDAGAGSEYLRIAIDSYQW